MDRYRIEVELLQNATPFVAVDAASRVTDVAEDATVVATAAGVAATCATVSAPDAEVWSGCGVGNAPLTGTVVAIETGTVVAIDTGCVARGVGSPWGEIMRRPWSRPELRCTCPHLASGEQCCIASTRRQHLDRRRWYWGQRPERRADDPMMCR